MDPEVASIMNKSWHGPENSLLSESFNKVSYYVCKMCVSENYDNLVYFVLNLRTMLITYT